MHKKTDIKVFPNIRSLQIPSNLDKKYFDNNVILRNPVVLKMLTKLINDNMLSGRTFLFAIVAHPIEYSDCTFYCYAL